MDNTSQSSFYSDEFSTVEAAEQQWIKQRRQAQGNIDEDAPSVGLAFSGGGIRSATFNLGVLQALAKRGLLSRVDYLSSVSGGGYIASCFSWLLSQTYQRDGEVLSGKYDLGSVPLVNDQGTLINWLRSNGSYLISGKGFSGWTLGGAILAGTLLNLTVLVPLFILLIGIASFDWTVFSWPSWLHIPGGANIKDHSGFMMCLWLGVASLACYLISTLLFAFSAALPILKRCTAHNVFLRLMGKTLALGIACIAIGIIPLLAELEEIILTHLQHDSLSALMHHFTYVAPALAGITSLMFAKRSNNLRGTLLANTGLALLIYGLLTLFYYLATETALLSQEGFYYWLGLSLVLALICNINGISMHHYYRGRLAQAFLPPIAAQFQRTEDAMDFPLAQLTPNSGAPLQLINTTLNTLNDRNPLRRHRDGENFVLSPLYCGSAFTGFRRTTDYLKGELSLSNAFAISGAAVDPNTYSTKSRALSFIMAFLNIRLGYWIKNPSCTNRGTQPLAWYRLIVREMLGVGLSAKKRFIHLSDGGHFDNTGIYELLKRRCQYIIVTDAGCDPEMTMSSLGQAVMLGRSDFGAEISWHGKPDNLVDALKNNGCLSGDITYSDQTTGKILYIKAVVTEHIQQQLPVDILSYARINPSFPNQSTADQFYDEMQFNCYRELGLKLTENIIGEHENITGLFS